MLDIMDAEPLVWSSVSKTVLAFGAVAAGLSMAAAAYALWGGNRLALDLGLLVTFLRVGAFGFLGGLVLAGAMFVLVRLPPRVAGMLKGRRRSLGARRAEPEERPWRLR